MVAFSLLMNVIYNNTWTWTWSLDPTQHLDLDIDPTQQQQLDLHLDLDLGWTLHSTWTGTWTQRIEDIKPSRTVK